MAYIYFLYSEKDDGWYIGCTRLTPEERWKRHDRGDVRSTKCRRPLRLVYVEQHTTHQEARKREWFLKHPKGYSEKQRIIENIRAQLAPKGAPRA